MAEYRRVHPDCRNASNPYHECSKYCITMIVETRKMKNKSDTEKKVTEEKKKPVSRAKEVSKEVSIQLIDDEEKEVQEVPATKNSAPSTYVSQLSVPFSSSPFAMSMLSDDKGTLGWDPQLDLPIDAANKLFDELSPSNLMMQWSSLSTKSTILSSGILFQWERDRQRIIHLMQENAKLQSQADAYAENLAQLEKVKEQLEKSKKENDTLSVKCRKLDNQMLEVIGLWEEDMNKARMEGLKDGRHNFLKTFPSTDEERSFLKEWSEKKIQEFLKSDRFKRATADKALRFYHYGFHYCRNELLKHGCRKDMVEDLAFLNVKEGLKHLPEGEYNEEEERDEDEENENGGESKKVPKKEVLPLLLESLWYSPWLKKSQLK